MTKLNKLKKIKNDYKNNRSKHNDCDKPDCDYYNNRFCPGDAFICLKKGS